MDEMEVFVRFNEAVRDAGGGRAFAKAHGVSESLVSRVLHGTRGINGRLLSAIGVERVISYRPLDGGDK